jgi:hypothetical protein
MQKITFHTFSMGDVEDPEIYAAQPIWEWQQTEMGKWVMTHCQDPRYSVGPDNRNWGHLVQLYGELEDADATFFQLRWSKIENS